MNNTLQSRLFHSLFFAVVLSLALGQLGRFDTTWGGLYLHDGIIGGWLILEVILYLKAATSQKKSPLLARLVGLGKPHLLLLGFFTWVCLGWIWFTVQQGELPLRGIVYAGKLICYGWWGVYVAPAYISKQLLHQSLVLIQTVGVIFGLGFFFMMPDARFLAILGWDDHYYRLLGVHLDPNITGLHLVLLWTAVTSSLITTKKNTLTGTTRMVIGLVLGLTSLAIMVTFSRAAYLAWLLAAIGIGALVALGKSKITLQPVLLTTLAVLILGTGMLVMSNAQLEGQNVLRTASIAARLASTRVYLSSLSGGEWLLGTGLFVPQPSQLHADNRAFLPDSWPVTMVVGTGWIGALLWLMILGKYLQLSQLHPADRRLIQLLVGIALFHALSINSLFYGFTWITLSLCIGAARNKSNI